MFHVKQNFDVFAENVSRETFLLYQSIGIGNFIMYS